MSIASEIVDYVNSIENPILRAEMIISTFWGSVAVAIGLIYSVGNFAYWGLYFIGWLISLVIG